MTLASASGLKAGNTGLHRSKQLPPERILPARLKHGDQIGLVTPGSSVTEEQLKECILKLEEMGFRTP